MTIIFGNENNVLIFTTSPAAGFVIPAIILIEELLPAPLGPNNPKISPEGKNEIINFGNETQIYSFSVKS